MKSSSHFVERYCVFRSDDRWYGMNALAVRSVTPRPAITPTPHSDPTIVGLCHLQNEFLPVLSMRSLTQIQYDTCPETEPQLLVLLGPEGAWGLLIDQIETLTELETSISNFSNTEDKWNKVALGSASWKNEVLEILDPSALYEYARSLTGSFWQNSHSTQPC
ncbi:MAG: chemotaxis protein CheW [Planctomycetota bacterium]